MRKSIYLAVLASELTHIFCCGLPVLVSALSLLASLGLVSVLPTGILAFHDMMHDYEIPLIIASALVLVLGWVLHFISRHLDCNQDSHCHHEPCAPKKNKASRILWFATALFFVNITVYFALHYNHGIINTSHAFEHSHTHYPS